MLISLISSAQTCIILWSYLDENGVAEAQSGLQILAEGVVEEAGLGDLALPVHVHDELGGLARRVDDQRVAVEALQHDRVLDGKTVVGQLINCPTLGLGLGLGLRVEG